VLGLYYVSIMAAEGPARRGQDSSATWARNSRHRACIFEGHPPPHQDQVPGGEGHRRKPARTTRRWIETTAGPRHGLGNLAAERNQKDLVRHHQQADDQARKSSGRWIDPGLPVTAVRRRTVIFLRSHHWRSASTMRFKAGISFGKGRHGGGRTQSGRSSTPPRAPGEGFRAAVQ